jgi:hypothetical protein
MPSAYLTTAEGATYGVPAVTTAQITQGSSLIDAFLRRPEGLAWSPDSQGSPCYMTALTPMMTFTLGGAIAPGSNVPVTLNSAGQILQVGDVLVLDRAAPSLVEACVVATTSGPPSAPVITLQTVLNAHNSGTTADLGLTIDEQKYMPESRPLTVMSRIPLMRVLSGVGRYGYGRRGDGANYNMEQFNLLAAVSKFGGPPVWELFQSTYPSAWDAATGQVWVPAGIMLAYYSEVKLRYVAGFPAAAIPAPVKLACAQIIRSVVPSPTVGDVKSYKAGDTSIEKFASSVIDADTKAMLQPYAVRALA